MLWSPGLAQTQSDQFSAFSQLRQEERWGPPADPTRRTSGVSVLKYVPIGSPGRAYAYVGGSLRQQARYLENEQIGRLPGSDTGFYTRAMLHGGLVVDRVRVFAELEHGSVADRRYAAGPADEDELDLSGAFLEVSFGRAGPNGASDVVRLGRQELSYGAGRLIAPRNGPNTRLSFDGALVRLNRAGWRTDLFLLRPEQTQPGVFDNRLEDGAALWGAYAARSWGEHQLDLFYFGAERAGGFYAEGVGVETRHTIGARWNRRTGPVTFDLEGAVQGGELETASDRGLDIAAWTLAAQATYELSGQGWRPTLGAAAGIASGDEATGDGELNTFRAPHPPGRYFGHANGLGPSNVAGAKASLRLKPTQKLTVEPRAYVLWRASEAEGIYSPGAPLRTDIGDETYLGWEPGVEGSYAFNRNISLAFSAARFEAGPFFRDAGPGRDATWLELSLEYVF
jgi:hypothetical protein